MYKNWPIEGFQTAMCGYQNMVPSHICIIQATELSASPRSLCIMGNFRKTKNSLLNRIFSFEKVLRRKTPITLDVYFDRSWHQLKRLTTFAEIRGKMGEKFRGLREKWLTWKTAKKNCALKARNIITLETVGRYISVINIISSLSEIYPVSISFIDVYSTIFWYPSESSL